MTTAKSRVISLRLKRGPAARLERLARLFRRSIGETAALLLDEKLKEEEFAFIEFRDSPLGRQACIQGTSLAVWEVVLIATSLEMDPVRIARHVSWPIEKVHAALAYASANATEIDVIVEDVRETTIEQVRATVPWVREVGR